jgi:hypothetical protein
LDTFVNPRDGQPCRAVPQSRLGHFKRAVPVGVGLYDGHKIHCGPNMILIARTLSDSVRFTSMKVRGFDIDVHWEQKQKSHADLNL